MVKRTKYLVLAGVLAGLPVTLPADAGVADECRSAPNHRPSEIGHWRYRVNPTSHRKCWYLKSSGGNLRSAARPHRVRVTRRAASEPPAATEALAVAEARRLDAPVIATRSAMLAANDALGIDAATARQPARPGVRNGIIAARWPEPVNAERRVAGATALTDGAVTDTGATAGRPGDVPRHADQTSVRAASRAPGAASGTSFLALLAGALVSAGAVGAVAFRQWGVHGRPRFAAAARAHDARHRLPRAESILPILARASAGLAPAGDAVPETAFAGAAPMAADEQVEALPGDVERRRSTELSDTATEIDRLLRQLDAMANAT